MDEKNLEQAIRYVREYQQRYSLDVLKKQLQSAGYSTEVVQKALAETTEKGNFWDFRSKKIYHSLKEKLIDGGLGFFLTGIVLPLLNFLPAMIGVREALWYGYPNFFWIVEIAAMIYLWNRRRYFTIGMIVGLVLSFVEAWFKYAIFYALDILLNPL